MKSPAGQTPMRRRVAKKQVRLDLRRAPPPPDPEDEMANRQRSNFWKWFGLVALFHLLVLVGVMIFYRETTPTREPPVISLVPLGDLVKGTPGTQEAPKLGATTAASVVHHHHSIPKPPTPPAPVTPPPVAKAQPPPDEAKPIIHEDNAPKLVSVPKPVKPKPAKPKIKVDLTLADGPAAEKTPPKHKHPKKPAPTPADKEDDADASTPDSAGLSKMQVASLIGKKIAAAGVANATKTGISGAADGRTNPFQDFYQSIHDQVMDKWQEPNQDSADATNPVVQIHVEKDGRVPPESVELLHGSGNQAIDDSALGAARALGYTLQPLPDDCPPDISITFKLTH
jgi:outer membrane biosynthesis protein TonB